MSVSYDQKNSQIHRSRSNNPINYSLSNKAGVVYGLATRASEQIL